MERYEIEFDVRYAYSLENYTETFNRRLHQAITFFQLFFSSIVFASVSGSALYGGVVVILTIVAFIIDPSKKSFEAQRQVLALNNLLNKMDSLSDNELHNEYKSIIKDGSSILGAFKNPAFNRASIRQGSFDAVLSLSTYESIMAWVGGDLPKNNSKTHKAS